jgi:hypothetical protein
VAIASPAKALFDYLYLRPSVGNWIQASLAEELRLNLSEFTSDDRREFSEYVLTGDPAKMGGVKMRRILTNLEKTVWQT